MGSAAAMTDAGANLKNPIEHFTPFGMALTPSAANDNQAAFTGHIRDTATGLTYMQARYYDPAIGRFLSIDPVTFLETGAPGMFNRYAYTLNNPINMIDPDGECTKDTDGNEVGVCGKDGVSQSYADQQMKDPHSITSATEKAAIAAGVKVEFDANAKSSSGGCDGSSCSAGVGNTPGATYIDDKGNISEKPTRYDEAYEHEMGHVFEALTNPPKTDTVTATGYPDQTTSDDKRVTKGHATTINRVNEYRKAKGRDYQRVCSRCTPAQARQYSNNLPKVP